MRKIPARAAVPRSTLLSDVPLDEPLRETSDLVKHVRRSYVAALAGRVGRLEHVVALVVDVLEGVEHSRPRDVPVKRGEVVAVDPVVQVKVEQPVSALRHRLAGPL